MVGSAGTVIYEEDLQCPALETKPVTPLTTEVSDQNKEKGQGLISCPICFSQRPVEQSDEHANSCLMWLLDDTNDQCDIQVSGHFNKNRFKTSHFDTSRCCFDTQ